MYVGQARALAGFNSPCPLPLALSRLSLVSLGRCSKLYVVEAQVRKGPLTEREFFWAVDITHTLQHDGSYHFQKSRAERIPPRDVSRLMLSAKHSARPQSQEADEFTDAMDDDGDGADGAFGSPFKKRHRVGEPY